MDKERVPYIFNMLLPVEELEQQYLLVSLMRMPNASETSKLYLIYEAKWFHDRSIQKKPVVCSSKYTTLRFFSSWAVD